MRLERAARHVEAKERNLLAVAADINERIRRRRALLYGHHQEQGKDPDDLHRCSPHERLRSRSGLKPCAMKSAAIVSDDECRGRPSARRTTPPSARRSPP